ncbi:hypothetical protein [Microbacterium arborescens]|uniref:hypothetical protein n=1 Tax=Microbacterium arborescens TaxID=33883 RepID=UPI000AC1A858|nr:hypothetical protein [Microbacterium arborescens]
MAAAQTEALMKALEDAAGAVATFTGIKKQFVDNGWSEPNAERMVIEMFRASGSGGK